MSGRMEKREVEAILENYLPAQEGEGRMLLEAMNYSVRAGGKRIRPILMWEMYHLLGGAEACIEPFMAAIEMIHTYSLVHDDLPAMDNDTLRRGRPTTWAVYGEAMGIVAGDGLLTYAFETAARAFALTSHPERVALALQLLARKAGIYGMAGGQAVDVALTGKPIDEATLDYIYRLKTGALLEASLMIGAALAGAGESVLGQTQELAAAIGMAFQIRDDMLDVMATQEELGKPIGSDARNEKTTYVTLYGMDRAKREVHALTSRATELLRALPGESAFLERLIGDLAERRM